MVYFLGATTRVSLSTFQFSQPTAHGPHIVRPAVAQCASLTALYFVQMHRNRQRHIVSHETKPKRYPCAVRSDRPSPPALPHAVVIAFPSQYNFITIAQASKRARECSDAVVWPWRSSVVTFCARAFCACALRASFCVHMHASGAGARSRSAMTSDLLAM